MIKHIISLGAGVQSSTMALMAAHGEITPMPDCAIFADTGAEPQGVYKWLDWLEMQLPFPVYRVSNGNLRDDILSAVAGLNRTGHLGQPPFFSEPRPGASARGMLRRKCTGTYKITPIKRKVRELTKGKACSQWIGISTDEVQRMKPSGVKYITHRWPLIERDMSRLDCLAWMNARGYPTPTKSACTFCPYHDDALWREMKANDPASFADAVMIDKAIEDGIPSAGAHFRLALHGSMKRLAEVDFRTAEDAGQVSLFDDECTGLCGT